MDAFTDFLFGHKEKQENEETAIEMRDLSEQKEDPVFSMHNPAIAQMMSPVTDASSAVESLQRLKNKFAVMKSYKQGQSREDKEQRIAKTEAMLDAFEQKVAELKNLTQKEAGQSIAELNEKLSETEVRLSEYMECPPAEQILRQRAINEEFEDRSDIKAKSKKQKRRNVTEYRGRYGATEETGAMIYDMNHKQKELDKLDAKYSENKRKVPDYKPEELSLDKGDVDCKFENGSGSALNVKGLMEKLEKLKLYNEKRKLEDASQEELARYDEKITVLTTTLQFVCAANGIDFSTKEMFAQSTVVEKKEAQQKVAVANRFYNSVIKAYKGYASGGKWNPFTEDEAGQKEEKQDKEKEKKELKEQAAVRNKIFSKESYEKNLTEIVLNSAKEISAGKKEDKKNDDRVLTHISDGNMEAIFKDVAEKCRNVADFEKIPMDADKIRQNPEEAKQFANAIVLLNYVRVQADEKSLDKMLKENAFGDQRNVEKTYRLMIFARQMEDYSGYVDSVLRTEKMPGEETELSKMRETFGKRIERVKNYQNLRMEMLKENDDTDIFAPGQENLRENKELLKQANKSVEEKRNIAQALNDLNPLIELRNKLCYDAENARNENKVKKAEENFASEKAESQKKIEQAEKQLCRLMGVKELTPEQKFACEEQAGNIVTCNSEYELWAGLKDKIQKGENIKELLEDLTTDKEFLISDDQERTRFYEKYLNARANIYSVSGLKEKVSSHFTVDEDIPELRKLVEAGNSADILSFISKRQNKAEKKWQKQHQKLVELLPMEKEADGVFQMLLNGKEQESSAYTKKSEASVLKRHLEKIREQAADDGQKSFAENMAEYAKLKKDFMAKHGRINADLDGYDELSTILKEKEVTKDTKPEEFAADSAIMLSDLELHKIRIRLELCSGIAARTELNAMNSAIRERIRKQYDPKLGEDEFEAREKKRIKDKLEIPKTYEEDKKADIPGYTIETRSLQKQLQEGPASYLKDLVISKNYDVNEYMFRPRMDEFKPDGVTSIRFRDLMEKKQALEVWISHFENDESYEENINKGKEFLSALSNVLKAYCMANGVDYPSGELLIERAGMTKEKARELILNANANYMDILSAFTGNSEYVQKGAEEENYLKGRTKKKQSSKSVKDKLASMAGSEVLQKLNNLYSGPDRLKSESWRGVSAGDDDIEKDKQDKQKVRSQYNFYQKSVGKKKTFLERYRNYRNRYMNASYDLRGFKVSADAGGSLDYGVIKKNNTASEYSTLAGEMKTSAKAVGVQLNADLKFGTKKNNLNSKLQAIIGKAEANAKMTASLRDKEGNLDPVLMLGASARAVFAEVSLKLGATIQGVGLGASIDFDTGFELTAKASFQHKKLHIDFGAALGLGVKFAIDVDLSGCKWIDKLYDKTAQLGTSGYNWCRKKMGKSEWMSNAEFKKLFKQTNTPLFAEDTERILKQTDNGKKDMETDSRVTDLDAYLTDYLNKKG